MLKSYQIERDVTGTGGDKVYCIFLADSREVGAMIDPTHAPA